MFGVGFTEILVIAVVAFIFIGPSRLPEFMRKAGRLFVQTRRFTNEARLTFDQMIRKAEDELDSEQREKLKEFLKMKNELAVQIAKQKSDLETAYEVQTQTISTEITGSQELKLEKPRDKDFLADLELPPAEAERDPKIPEK